ATRDAYRRNLPGRLVGVSVDASQRRALRLALQTREQHIRRERATSNICTAQVLLANIAAMYAVYHGPDGLRSIAERVHASTRNLAASIAGVVNDTFFDTIAVTVDDADAVLERARTAGFNLRKIDDNTVGVAFDETTTPDVVDRVRELFTPGSPSAVVGIPDTLRRRSEPLVHPVFRTYHSESQMLRYLRRLADRDL